VPEKQASKKIAPAMPGLSIRSGERQAACSLVAAGLPRSVTTSKVTF
jgi:hypothetical protein